MDPTPSSVDRLSGLDLVVEVAVTYLEIAAGHLGGLAALYKAAQVMHPAPPLIRAVMESAGRAAWVIGRAEDDPADVLARAYLEEFLSAEIAKRAAKHMAEANAAQVETYAQRRAQVRTRILSVFPTATKAELGQAPKVLAGRVQAGPEAAVTFLFELVREIGGGTVTSDQTVGMYDYLSSGTHPTLYTARELRVAVEHDDHVRFDLATEVEPLRRMAGAAFVAFYSALSYVASYLGLPRARIDALAEAADEALPGVFATS
jgi:hypothetical protein